MTKVNGWNNLASLAELAQRVTMTNEGKQIILRTLQENVTGYGIFNYPEPVMIKPVTPYYRQFEKRNRK